MNDFAGILDHQVRTLSDALRRQQETRCRDVVADAEHRARLAVRDSRRKLHDRQHQAVHEERRRREHELLLASSRIETRRRQRAFEEHSRVLESAWPLLEGALRQRWEDPAKRLAWCDMILAEASRALTGSDWIVEHPGDLSENDRNALTERLGRLGIARPTFVPCDDFGSGLRIKAGTACLDGTAAGLLAARAGVEALLLAAWERTGEADDG